MQKERTKLKGIKHKNLQEVLFFENKSACKSRDKILNFLKEEHLNKIIHVSMWLYGTSKNISIDDLIEIRHVLQGRKRL